MKQIDTCEMCHQRAAGKRYEFYYGLFLGNTDVFIGGPGTTGNRWTEHYQVIGRSDAFICQHCIDTEFWKRVFKEPRLPELEVRWFDLFLFFLGFGLVTLLVSGIVKIFEFFGAPMRSNGSDGTIFLLIYLTVVSTIVLLIMKISTYALDFGIEVAYRTKFQELPKIPKLICIAPSKYKLLKHPGSGPSKTTEPKKQPTQKSVMPAPTPIVQKVCPKCGQIAQPKDRFCRNCGSRHPD